MHELGTMAHCERTTPLFYFLLLFTVEEGGKNDRG